MRHPPTCALSLRSFRVLLVASLWLAAPLLATAAAVDLPSERAVTDSAIQEDEADLFAEDFFPATPGDQWVYLVNGKTSMKAEVADETVFLNGVETRIFEFSDGSREYYSVDADGVKLHRFYLPNVRIQGLGKVHLTITLTPPAWILNGVIQVGQTLQSSGTARTNRLPRVGIETFPYEASFTVEPFATVTVPAGVFEVVRVTGNIEISGQTSDPVTLDLAEGIGIVRTTQSVLGVVQSSELVSHRVGIEDLAITKITPPTTVTLTAKKPVQTKQVVVTIQNRSRHAEVILDRDMLGQLVTLGVESLGTTCNNITPVLHIGSPQKSLPRLISPKKTLDVIFDVTFDCANDAGKSTSKHPGREDFRYVAVVNHEALDGKADIDPQDDVCPRDMSGTGIDANPDGKVRDLGCGARKPDKTYGADVLTDVILK